MKKFDELCNNFLNEDESLDQWHTQKMNQEHNFDTLSHPIKDQMIEEFKNWIKAGEHQDGEAFWDNFENEQEAVEDFLRTLIGG